MRKIILIIIVSVQVSFAQFSIDGIVKDSSNNYPIAFASIGVQGTPFGTVCDEEGKFHLKIKSSKDTDSLKIAAIGYLTKTIDMLSVKKYNNVIVRLNPSAIQLGEVLVKAGKTMRISLGNKRYNKKVYCSFVGFEENYKGAEASIKANNKDGRLVWIEEFNFYILRNSAPDSIIFRLNLYAVTSNGMPAENILKSPIIFKTKIKEGVVHLDLINYNISTTSDFFISLECLEDKMTKEMLAFSGSIVGPSYYKFSTFGPWIKTRYQGLDFNVTVSYQK